MTTEPADCSVLEAAVELGVSPSVVERLLDQGTLPGHDSADGRERRIDLADLREHRDERFSRRGGLARSWLQFEA